MNPMSSEPVMTDGRAEAYSHSYDYFNEIKLILMKLHVNGIIKK